ncbi:hypothetical protein COO60DRAFT_1042114 [Scenedesmus sp. NREL 46B-D3]|nr:hypothetical protein COO60DRAFT_1042114 [Scenedesmus sp. NREL 46B-D3]
MQGLDPFQLVALLLQLLKLDKPTQGDDVADYQQFVASVYGWMMDRLPRFRGRQISGALYAISRLNLYNAELVGALVQASLPILHEFSAMEYVRFLDGLQRMQVPPGDEWVNEFFRSSADKIVRTADRDELPAIFSFCQRLGWPPRLSGSPPQQQQPWSSCRTATGYACGRVPPAAGGAGGAGLAADPRAARPDRAQELPPDAERVLPGS